MGLLDLSKAKAAKRLSTRRRDCKTYADAYAYFQYNVQMWKKQAEKKGVDSLPIFGKLDDGLTLQLSLHQMPLYWNVEETGGETVWKKWDATEGKLVETAKFPSMIGMTHYPIDTHDEGWQLVQALAENEDEDFKAVLTRAAKGMVDQEASLDAINEYAEHLYNESEWKAELKGWSEPDEGTKQSKKKAQKKSQFKQTARRRLGYDRATDVGVRFV